MTAAAELQVVCAWCQSEGEGPPRGPNQSHGCCARHARQLEEEIAAFTKNRRPANKSAEGSQPTTGD